MRRIDRTHSLSSNCSDGAASVSSQALQRLGPAQVRLFRSVSNTPTAHREAGQSITPGSTPLNRAFIYTPRNGQLDLGSTECPPVFFADRSLSQGSSGMPFRESGVSPFHVDESPISRPMSLGGTPVGTPVGRRSLKFPAASPVQEEDSEMDIESNFSPNPRHGPVDDETDIGKPSNMEIPEWLRELGA